MPASDFWNCGAAITTAIVEMKDGTSWKLGRRIDMNELYKTNRVLSNQVWTVAHFLDHLHSLHSCGVLDRRLASALFESNVSLWVEMLGSEKVVWGRSQGFFDKNIQPLKNEL